MGGRALEIIRITLSLVMLMNENSVPLKDDFYDFKLLNELEEQASLTL